MKIGASHSSKGLEEGIHWYINSDVKIEFASLDDKEQEIPWVRYTNTRTGEQKTFVDEELNISDEMLDTLNIRNMDCLDCHNRPSHVYNLPTFFVNNAISNGNIPKSLPEIKNLCIGIYAEEFTSTDSALNYIDQSINIFYEENYPDYFSDSTEYIRMAILGLQEEFQKNIFPEMKVRWVGGMLILIILDI